MENQREQKGTQFIAGRKPVLEVIRSGASVEKIVILYGAKGAAIERIKHLAKQNHIPVVEAGKAKFRKLASDTTTQGVIAIVGQKEYSTVDDMIIRARDRREDPFLLILDEIEDPQNLGALIRTADCAGVHGVILPRHHAASLTEGTVRSSAGATEHMLIAKVANIAATIDELKGKGFWIIGADPSADRVYTELDYTSPLALVIGNEGRGIRTLVKGKCDFLVRIPLYGKIESLNASVAGALIMYEVVRKRKNLREQVMLKEGTK